MLSKLCRVGVSRRHSSLKAATRSESSLTWGIIGESVMISILNTESKQSLDDDWLNNAPQTAASDEPRRKLVKGVELARLTFVQSGTNFRPVSGQGLV